MSGEPPAAGRPHLRLHRSYLYAPGDRPEVVRKAAAAGADAIVVDLEDAVAPADRPAARRAVAAALAGDLQDAPCEVHVRLDRDGAGWSRDDLAAVVGPTLAALRLPKADDGDALRALDEELTAREEQAGLAPGTVALYPTIESAAGLVAAGELLTATRRIARLAFGATDYLADIRAHGDEDLATAYPRSALVVASRVASVGPPIDSVHTDLDDADGLERAARRARALGFFGKSVIHPRQLEVVHRVFTASAEELDWARRVLAALDGDGVATLDGVFVDAAVAARARAVLELEESTRG